MRILSVTAIVVSTVYANVDIVHTDAGLCVGWSTQDETVLWNADESTLHYFGSGHESISLGLNDGLVTGVPSLVVAVSSDDGEQNDSIMVFDAMNCIMLDSRPVVCDSILSEVPPAPYSIHDIHVSRYSHGMRMLMGCSMGAYTSTNSTCFITNTHLIDESGSIGFNEHRCRMWDQDYYWPPRMSGPVGLLGSSVSMQGYGYPPWPYEYRLVSLAWDLPVNGCSRIDSLFNCTFYSVSTEETPEPLVLALGSCGNQAVALWQEEGDDGNINTSLFIGDVSPAVTEEFPFPAPLGEPAAMSRHPYFWGMLLVWTSGDSLMCRHYDGEWNDFDRVVQTGIGTVGNEDLAVCAVEDGYWLAWLETGELFPEVLFVPEDSVTGIGPQTGIRERVGLELYPNPFTASVRIKPLGITGSCAITVYDASGRTVARHEPADGEWTWFGSNAPSGIYHVVVSSDAGYIFGKLVHLR